MLWASGVGQAGSSFARHLSWLYQSAILSVRLRFETRLPPTSPGPYTFLRLSLKQNFSSHSKPTSLVY